MLELRLQHILTVIQILTLGGRHNFIEITTADLAKAIKRSQQAASKHLLELMAKNFELESQIKAVIRSKIYYL
jgi:riboflavin kinase